MPSCTQLSDELGKAKVRDFDVSVANLQTKTSFEEKSEKSIWK